LRLKTEKGGRRDREKKAGGWGDYGIMSEQRISEYRENSYLRVWRRSTC
jgi:hypothetical protein